MLQNDVESVLVEFLAEIYCRIRWGKIKTMKNPHDVFNHRVRAAAKRSTLYRFASKLCNYFGIQSISAGAQLLLDKIRAEEKDVLIVLSAEHIPYCVRAIVRAKILKEQRKKEKKEKGEKDDQEI